MPGNKVVRYKRRPRAVAFIFALVLIYIICFFVLYTTKAKVQTYEVNVGSLTNNAVFTALAVRRGKCIQFALFWQCQLLPAGRDES